MSLGGFIYFMKPVNLNGPIKIGHTVMPDHRLCVLGYWSPFELEFIGLHEGTIGDEWNLHTKFASYRLHNEWFLPSDEMNDCLAKLSGGVPLREAFSLDVIKAKRRDKNGYKNSYSWREIAEKCNLIPAE